MTTFFGDDDFRAYRALPAEACRTTEVEVAAYCLMPSLAQLDLPDAPAGMRSAVTVIDRRSAAMIDRLDGRRAGADPCKNKLSARESAPP